MSYKRLFSRALAAAPGRLHFAAHSHHLWPDASYEGHLAAWEDAARLADTKWDRIFGEVIPEARSHVARELNLPDPADVVFASNTHDFLVRLASAWPGPRPVRILSSDGEFHSFRRQAARWEEAGAAVVERVPSAPAADFAERFLARARAGGHDLILVSQVFFRTGTVFAALAELAELADPAGPWVIVDGYHGFMAVETDLSALADRLFYVAGGYKYAMAGEGAGLLCAPRGFGPRPAVTGWFAEFGDLQGPPGGVGYAADAGRFWGATFDASGLYRFNAVRRMLDAEGLTTAEISAHAAALMRRFAGAVAAGEAGAALAGAELLNPLDGGPHARFLAYRHRDAQAWKRALLAEGVVADVRDDTLRFGFGLYQDPADVETLIGACARILG